MKIVVVTATYNEKDNIGKLITLLEEEVFPKIKHYDMCLLVADDNSPDGTADIVRGFMQKYSNLDINSGPKKGLGAAYMRTMSYAIEHMGADIVMSIDADLQHDPHAIPEFLKKIEQGYDVVCGTRYSDGGSMPKNWPLYRKAFSVIGNFTVRAVTGRFHLHDWTSGFRAIKKDVHSRDIRSWWHFCINQFWMATKQGKSQFILWIGNSVIQKSHHLNILSIFSNILFLKEYMSCSTLKNLGLQTFL